MNKLMSLILALVLVGTTTAARADTDPEESDALTATTSATMSCFVDTRAYDEFTPGWCFAVIPRAMFATAVFRIDPPLPQRYQVLWSDRSCNASLSVCSVRIRPFSPKTMTATVLDLDNHTFFQVSATAEFENGM